MGYCRRIKRKEDYVRTRVKQKAERMMSMIEVAVKGVETIKQARKILQLN